MNKEMVSRLRKAAEYKKLAIHALLPERAVKHMEVIEKELHEMVVEMAAEVIKGKGNGGNAGDDNNQGDAGKEKGSGARKIDIG